jgi:hypothetical protein
MTRIFLSSVEDIFYRLLHSRLTTSFYVAGCCARETPVCICTTFQAPRPRMQSRTDMIDEHTIAETLHSSMDDTTIWIANWESFQDFRAVQAAHEIRVVFCATSREVQHHIYISQRLHHWHRSRSSTTVALLALGQACTRCLLLLALEAELKRERWRSDDRDFCHVRRPTSSGRD